MSRVAQLDSYLLDDELNNILAAPVSSSPEFRLALKSSLLYLGLLGSSSSSNPSRGASYGASLQNLVYDTASRRKRWIFLLLCTLPGYFYTKLRDRMLVNGWPDYPRARRLSADPARRRRELRRWCWDTVMKLENVWMTLKLVNFLLFLKDGLYPTLLTRLLKLRFSLARKSVARNVSFDFLNRQLVWEVFTEFLLFMMPLVDLQSVPKWISRKIVRSLRFWQFSGAQNGGTADDEKNMRKARRQAAPFADLPPNVCAICRSRAPLPSEPMDPIDPMTSTTFLASMTTTTTSDGGGAGSNEAVVPYITQCCGARYCYYCITSTLLQWQKDREERERDDTSPKVKHDVAEKDQQEAPGWACLRCGDAVRSVKRWEGNTSSIVERDVMEGKDPLE